MRTAITKDTLLRWRLDERPDRPCTDPSEHAGKKLRYEFESLSDLAKIGELVSTISHEVNNFINAMLLQLSVFEAKLPGDAGAELAAIREQALGLTALMEHLRKYRRRQQRIGRPVDLHRTIWRNIYEMNRYELEQCGKPRFRPTNSKRVARARDSADDGIPLLLKLTPGLPKVNDCAVDLRNLCAFLLSHAAAVTPANGSISIRTVVSDDKVLLGVEDCGPNVDSEQLSRFFEASGANRAGVNGLELAACKGLAARLGGRIEAQNLPRRGVAIYVDLPLSSSGGD
jgi:signal transduction histidine kinase